MGRPQRRQDQHQTTRPHIQHAGPSQRGQHSHRRLGGLGRATHRSVEHIVRRRPRPGGGVAADAESSGPRDMPLRFPEYARREEPPAEPGGYRGTDQVVIGGNGYLYENGYINEYLGFSKKYSETTDADLLERAVSLKAVQDALAARGIAFCVVFTPSKAASLPQYIPEWYTARYAAAPDYIRP